MRTTRRSFIARGVSGAAGTCILGGGWWADVAIAVSDQAIVTVKPQEYPRALRNPLMGFRPGLGRRAFEHEYATLARHYIKWNEIENAEDDGIDRIRAFCHEKWKGVEAANLKVIPRVYLHWGRTGRFAMRCLEGGDRDAFGGESPRRRSTARTKDTTDETQRQSNHFMKYNTPSLTSLVRKFSLIGLISISALSLVQAAPPPSSFGVWDRGDTFDAKEYPFLKGMSFNDSWGNIEKQSGVFDWSGLDQAIEKAFRNKMYMYLSFGAGPGSPKWIYDQGVPKVFTEGGNAKENWTFYPYYLSPAYKKFYERFLTEAGKHVRSYPLEKQERIAFIQVKTGCTGDECAYKGNVKEARYELKKNSPEWREFRLWAFDLYVKNFQETPGPKIDLLFNSVNNDVEGAEKFTEEWNWVTNRVKGGFGIKNGALSRGHHMRGERTLYDQWTSFLIDPKGLTLFRRSEMDQTWQQPWYQLNLPLSFYWGAVNALNGGQSVWDISRGAIATSKGQGFDYSFYFFNRYAGQIYPETATGAFCALHKGLDAADTKAYPEAKFGQASKGNVDRMLKICAEFSKYGASADDKASLTMGQVEQRRSQKGFNDVGWDIWPDNYGRFLYQIDADETSIPLWRVGGPITKTSSIYSRFARGFEHASGKDAMYFKLHDGFSKDAQPKVMSITIVWYDAQAGSTWKLDYDAGKPTMKTALSVTGKGDKQWHDETITLKDAVLYHGGPNGSDLALVNTDDKDDIFSIIEVHRGVPEGPVLRPPSIRPSTDQKPATDKEAKKALRKQQKAEGKK